MDWVRSPSSIPLLAVDSRPLRPPEADTKDPRGYPVYNASTTLIPFLIMLLSFFRRLSLPKSKWLERFFMQFALVHANPKPSFRAMLCRSYVGYRRAQDWPKLS